ncbi:hypothetical protein PAMA_011781 [Pampus argenteus]
MNADVTFRPAVHPWSKITNTSSLNLTKSDTAAWIFSSLPPVQNSSRLASERMEPGRRGIAPGEPDPSPHQLESQLDFFHKLGYSTAQVEAVQKKFGSSMDTDKVLGELVKIGAGPEAAKQSPVTMSVLVPRGDTQDPTLLLPVTITSPQTRDVTCEDEDVLRPIVIDGSNVAMSHGNKEVFSCLGIQLTVNFFLDRGHTKITVFVPSWRKEHPRPDVPITDQHILRDLEKRKILVFTPSRHYGGKRVVCNDDRFIVQLGYDSDGIIVSNDMYRDLQVTEPEWKRFIEERLLMYSFVNDKFMPPDDPLGRHGPTLENFLRKYPKTQKKQPCPYGKKCTYGIKCKFHHPERAKQSNRLLADTLRENAKHPSTAQKQSLARSSPVPGQSLSLVEDMAQKLTLGPEGGSLKKDNKKENVAQVKLIHRSSKRASCRKEKSSLHPPSDQGSVWHGGSQEQLDSGLGSIDSQPMEAPWSQPTHSLRQQYCLPRSAPCSCCSCGPPSLGNTPAFQCHSIGHSSDMIPYGPPHYANYGGYPVSMPAYSQPANFQQQQPYWSAHPPAVHSLPAERSPWEPPQGSQSNPSRQEREVVRKKLLAIFSAQLVDTAMDRFPQLMDPQMLAAEILMLQSRNRMR